jgi:hypothetical protein
VRILLQSKDYLPGDKMEGTVVISSDSALEYGRVAVSLQGEEHTRVIRGSRKHRRLYEEARTHSRELLELSGAGVVGPGDTQFHFQFALPEDCLGSYYGLHGSIRYSLKAVVETSEAHTVETSEEVFVFILTAAQPFKSTSTSISEDSTDVLNIQLPANTINLGQELNVRIRVASQAEFRGVRAEIVHREYVLPEGYETDTRTTFSRWYAKKDELEKERWIDIVLKSSPNWPISFKSNLIKSQYLLRVTMDIPWRFDKSVEIPIQAILHTLPR